jgi:hypothetical protein
LSAKIEEKGETSKKVGEFFRSPEVRKSRSPEVQKSGSPVITIRRRKEREGNGVYGVNGVYGCRGPNARKTRRRGEGD